MAVWKSVAGFRVWFFCSLLLPNSVLKANHFDVTIEAGVSLKLPDGVVLFADIYRPRQEGRFPILLQRTP